MSKYKIIKGELACQEVFIVITKDTAGKIKRCGVFETEKEAQIFADKLNKETKEGEKRNEV